MGKILSLIQIARDPKTRRFTDRKECSEGKVKDVAGQFLLVPGENQGFPACRRCGFDPWVGKIPWRRAQPPTPVFLPGESHGWRSLADYSPWGHKESDTTERLTLSLSFPLVTSQGSSLAHNDFPSLESIINPKALLIV